MMIAIPRTAALAVAALMMALAPVAASAGPNHANLGGGARGGAKSSVNRGGGAAKYAQNGGANRNMGGANRPGGNNRPGGKPGRGNVVAGNTVVVNGQGGRGNGYNNNYNNGGHWDNDDNDFLEFVGKTAAITAGVSIVSAVIGSTVNDKPDDCQQSMSNGQVYMNCNGTWYQPVMNNGQQQYTVIAPPR